MLKQEIEALLKVECGDDFELRLYPVRLSRKQLTRPEKYDWLASNAIYWVGQLDTDMGYITTNQFHYTNHKAASELYKKYTLWKS